MRVAVAGFGTIGKFIARRLVEGLPGFALTGLVGRDPEKTAREARLELGQVVPVVEAGQVPEHADVLVECVPSAAFAATVAPTIAAGRTLITVSSAALLDHLDLVETARQSGGRIVLATGALLGLDAVRAAALGTIHSVRMVTRKPPMSLAKADYLVRNRIDVLGLKAPLQVFAGTARDGARAFPANVNVAASLALAGIGPDRTMLEIWADPALERNTHRIHVDADSARFEMMIENVPSPENPGTGKITALSILAALTDLAAPLRVGT